MEQKRPALNRPRRGPMGGPHGPGAFAGEKAKDFSGAMKKLIRYMKRNVPAILTAFLLAIVSVILTLNVPNILGEATDELIIGVTRMTVYDQIHKIQDSMEELGAAIAKIPPEELGPLMADDSTTIKKLADRGYVSQELLDALGEELAGTRLSALMQSGSAGGAASYQTIGELVAAMEKASPEAGKLVEKIPEKYREDILQTSLETRPTVDLAAIGRIILILGGIIGCAALLMYFQGFIMAGVAQRLSYRFRRDIDQKINRLPLKFFDTTTHGEVMSLITNDVDTISTTLNQSLSQILTSAVTLVGVLVMMLRISWILTLASLVILPLAMLFISLVVKRSQKHFMRQQEYLGHVNGHIEEMYAGHTVVQLYNGEEKSMQQFGKFNDELYSSAWRSQFLSGLMQPVMGFIGNLGFVMVCVLGGFLTVQGMITIGNIQAFVQYLRQFNQPIAQMATIMNTLQSTAAAAERVFGFLEETEEQETGEALPEHVKGDVSFEHVKFGYTSDKVIIHDFSADVKAGQRVAIVGPTGAGKTTIVKLLMRFYETNSGKITIDGVDIKSYLREGLRSEVGMVLQDTWLFNGTIMENIRYGRLDATDEEVYAAAKMACADHFIRTLPGGYGFVINEEAGNVSQGQKQLLTIARAILADPALLILDEATSSVDTRTELLIQKAMERLMQNRTSFIIAHRLSTIRDADLILVLKDGDIVEQGTHQALLAEDGFYAALYNSQFERNAG